MTNFERCCESKTALAATICNMSNITTEALRHINWNKWFESDLQEPIFENAIHAQYTPSAKHDRWYDCLVLSKNKTLLGKPAALIWTLAGDHVAIIISQEHIRYL